MAIKQVKQYYKQVEKMYMELATSLSEAEEEFKKGEITEQQRDNLLIPIQGLKENYIRLSYIKHLLMEPNRKSKKGPYEKQHKKRTEYFKNNNLTAEQDIELEKNILKTFEQNLKEGKFDKHE